MKNKLKLINKVIKVSLILLFATFVQKVNATNESKVTNTNLNKTLDLHAMAEVIEAINYSDKYAVLDTYFGSLSGYGADCKASGCSGALACPDIHNEQQKWIDVINTGITTYNDPDYGEVRIVASSRNLKCGSIIQFEASHISDETITAIVLDRGVAGTKIDLLTESESYANKYIGRTQIKYDVIRSGWEK